MAFMTMEKERFPAVKQDEIVVSIDWNENIDIDENLRRVRSLLEGNRDMILQANLFIGEQKFLFNRDYDQSYTQAKVYLRTKDYDLKDIIEQNLYRDIRNNYPVALLETSPQQNIFEKIFSAAESPLIVELSLMKEKTVPPADRLLGVVGDLQSGWPEAGISPPSLEDKILLRLNPGKLLLYGVEPMNLYNTLKAALNQYNIGELRASYELLPIVLTGREKQISEIIAEQYVISRKGQAVPVREIVSVQRVHDYKSIKGGMNGEYVPVNMNITTNTPGRVTAEIRNLIKKDESLDVRFSGGLITGQRLFRELAIVLVVALLLLYFILAA
ncbi:MAG TPA: efflux RND transporter permease subunit, partial [Bacteroidales bacterium]|nr:efflux RND transporter permease subunit [Bacteroidales bacterium]